MRSPSHARRAAIASLAIIGALAVAACSSAATGAPGVDTSRINASEASGAAVPQPAASGGDLFGAAASAGPVNPLASSAPGNADTYIVRTGSMSIEVPKIDPALDQVRTAILGLGGYVSASDQTNQPDQASASVTYRIPVARWQDALDAITRIAAKVDSAKSNAVEVTGQVLDLGARIDNLRTTEQALQAIMARATKISDVLAVESQLSDVQGQIEQLTTQQAHLKDQAALGTLTVAFSLPPTEAIVQTSRGWDPGAQLDQASAALLGFGQGLGSLAIWLIVVGVPVAIFVLILFGLAFLVARRVHRKASPSGLATPPAEG